MAWEDDEFPPDSHTVVLIMFEKKSVDKQPAHTEPSLSSAAAPGAGTTSSATTSSKAVIGASIVINGDVSGDENLLVEGRVNGSIDLSSHQLAIGQSGQVDANVTAKNIRIDGEVKGDITGYEKVVISKSGNVRGNIVAPRVTLEDGAKFKGSIDMDPAVNASTATTAKPAEQAKRQQPDSSAGKAAASSGG